MRAYCIPGRPIYRDWTIARITNPTDKWLHNRAINTILEFFLPSSQISNVDYQEWVTPKMTRVHLGHRESISGYCLWRENLEVNSWCVDGPRSVMVNAETQYSAINELSHKNLSMRKRTVFYGPKILWFQLRLALLKFQTGLLKSKF